MAVLACLSIFVAWAIVGNYAAYIGAIFVVLAFIPTAFGAQWKQVMLAPWVLAFVSAFFLVTLAFSLQSAHGSTNFIGDFALFALAPVFAVAALPLAKKRFTVIHLGWIFWSGSVVAAGWALFRQSQGVYRGTAIELSPIHFADLAMICGFLGLVVLFDTASRWRWLALSGPVFAIIAVLIAETRSAVLVGICLSGVCGVFLWRAWSIETWKKLVVLACVPLCMVAAFYLASLLGFDRAFQVFDAVGKTLTGDEGLDSSSYARVEMYRAALIAIADSPWIGHGWHEQISVTLEYMSEYAQQRYELEKWGYIHNDFLSLTVSAGLAGALAYFLALAAPLLAVRWRSGRDERLVFVAVTASSGIFLCGMTDVLFMVEIPKIFLVMTAAVLFVLSASNRTSIAHD
ncbi:O-antigen ligase family protein [Devosia sp. MC521]|uniref:O-antigen ligase family protein n=1 Tax=Devosia sp. MC521 TaxID=2759954 RepID=UPI0015F995B7|nr:O-antigen ligase family protein [Devosia sp. MC521]MBJ6987201.1 O-antigen ligase family protein [Devosia sp. MC521]QMW62815.1 O-antigen ligase family protein [Devosia sp. MC521]